MKKSMIFFCCFFLLSIFLIMMYNKNPEKFIVQTFSVYNEEKIIRKISFLNKIIIKSPSDDFIEKIDAYEGDYITSGSVLLKMESKEEAYELAKAKNDFAISLLNSGKAIQEEKQQAVILAENKLENTHIRAPIDGYIYHVETNEKLFVTKGTVLFELLREDSKGYVQIFPEEEQLLKKAEFIEIKINQPNLKLLLEKAQITEHKNNRFLLLPFDIKSINGNFSDPIICEINITYIEDKVSWIPVEYVYEKSVFLEGNQQKEIKIIEQKKDLVLVQGLSDSNILIKKR